MREILSKKNTLIKEVKKLAKKKIPQSNQYVYNRRLAFGTRSHCSIGTDQLSICY